MKSISYAVAAAMMLQMPTAAIAEPAHGISMSGSLDLPADFANLPYANPNAEVGGRIVYAENGTFDAFAPYIVAGKTPYGFKVHIYESFLKRSIDESFSLYGLLAETVDMADDRTSIEFHLNPDAKFSDGTPVTIEDALWSYNILAEKGTSRYGRYMGGVDSMEQTGDYSIKFTMSGENRELPLLLGLMPIMKKAEFEGVEFDKGSLTPTTGSGAYIVDDFKMGEFITFKRNPDYWGNDLPINKGQNNLEEIKYVYFTDPSAMFEAFKAGDVNIFVEGDVKRWDRYDFEAFNNGEIQKTEILHSRPTGMEGFYFNTRRAPYDDWRVREALITGFNFPFINKTINEGKLPRIESPFSNSYLGMDHGPAEGRVKELLEPFAADLPPGALEGYTLPEGNETGRDRDGIAHAMKMLEEAGYSIQDGVMKSADGVPLEVNVSVKSADDEKYANLWADGLKPMGVALNIVNLDASTHTNKLNEYDFDVIYSITRVSLSPGNEQYRYWGSEAADTPETRNWMGAKVPAIDAMIDEILRAENLEDYTAAVKALDRILMAERFVVPIWHNPTWRVIHDARLNFPSYVPKYGYWPGYAPDSMYWEE